MSLTALAAACILMKNPEIQSQIPKDRRIQWWREARFGMFIHWGLYAIPAGTWKDKKYGGGVEWILNQAQVKVKDYEPLIQQWNPEKYDPKAWVRIAKEAGMKYIVITSKHHEGWALWDTKTTDWDAMNTPYKRDLLKPLAEECQKQGIKLGFYYSIMDWHHPDYSLRRSWDPRTELPAPNMDRYTEFMKAQLKELLTNYGPIATLWFDGEWESPWTAARGRDLYDYVLSLQPNIIINNRVDKGRSGMAGMTQGDHRGDYGTPEQEIPRTGLKDVDWESCMTMNDTWGFSAHDLNWKSGKTLVHNLIETASKGGNYLLNVGPTGLGEIPGASVARLAEVGAWMKINSEAIYGAQAGPFTKSPHRWTMKGKTLYAHLLNWPGGSVDLPGFKTKIKSVRMLGGSALRHSMMGEVLRVTLPASAPHPHAAVLAIECEDPRQVSDTGLTLTGQPLSLSVGLGRVHGTTLKMEESWLGFWTKEEDWVSWDFEVAKAGAYDVRLEMACDPPSAGSAFEVLLEGARLSGKVASTGSWKTFNLVKVGRVNLNKGPATLIVRPKELASGALMNLKSVSLVPASL